VHEEETWLEKYSLEGKLGILFTPENSSKIVGFSAFKVMAIPLIIYGYTFYLSNIASYNYFSFNEEIYDQFFAKIALSAYFVPDIFFFMSGYLFAKKAFTFESIKEGAQQRLLGLTLRKIKKLYPLYLCAIIIYWTISPSLHSGPVWHIYEQEAMQCNVSWWKALLLIDNWFAGDSCYEFSWFISTEIQLVFVTVVFFLVYYRNKKAGLVLLAALIVTFFVLLLTISSPLPSSLETTLDRSTALYFESMHSHAPFYFFGVLNALISAKESTSHLFLNLAKNRLLNVFFAIFGSSLIVLIVLRPEIWSNVLGLELGLSRIGMVIGVYLLMFKGIFNPQPRVTLIHRFASLSYSIILFSGMIVASSFWCLFSFPYLDASYLQNSIIPNTIISVLVGGFMAMLISLKSKGKEEEEILL